jgi:hypothetical protein
VFVVLAKYYLIHHVHSQVTLRFRITPGASLISNPSPLHFQLLPGHSCITQLSQRLYRSLATKTTWGCKAQSRWHGVLGCSAKQLKSLCSRSRTTILRWHLLLSRTYNQFAGLFLGIVPPYIWMVLSGYELYAIRLPARPNTVYAKSHLSTVVPLQLLSHLSS